MAARVAVDASRSNRLRRDLTTAFPCFFETLKPMRVTPESFLPANTSSLRSPTRCRIPQYNKRPVRTSSVRTGRRIACSLAPGQQPVDRRVHIQMVGFPSPRHDNIRTPEETDQDTGGDQMADWTVIDGAVR